MKYSDFYKHLLLESDHLLDFRTESIVDSLPLPDGNYYALRYGYTLEVKMTKDFSSEGKKFKTKTGVRCGREHCGGPQKITIKNGKIAEPLLEQDDRYSQINSTQRNLVG